MLTKEDLMLLSKERLAELLEEYLREKNSTGEGLTWPSQPVPYVPSPSIPTYPTYPWVTYTADCANGGKCTNPFHDCINCPQKTTVG